MALKIKVGDPLPSVGLRATDGYLLNLRSFVTKQPVVFLFFGAPTMEGAARRRGQQAAQGLAADHDRLRQAGIAAVGVTCDSEQQQLDFTAKATLPYLLFSDERRIAAELLGIDTVARGANVNVARPLAIAVDRDGIVRAVVDRVDPEVLVDRVLRVLATPMPTALAQPAPAEPPAAGA
ncbi:MAG: redoxin domain-containing protein [Candidatus Limnocylindria bacterium]